SRTAERRQRQLREHLDRRDRAGFVRRAESRHGATDGREHGVFDRPELARAKHDISVAAELGSARRGDRGGDASDGKETLMERIYSPSPTVSSSRGPFYLRGVGA